MTLCAGFSLSAFLIVVRVFERAKWREERDGERGKGGEGEGEGG